MARAPKALLEIDETLLTNLNIFAMSKVKDGAHIPLQDADGEIRMFKLSPETAYDEGTGEYVEVPAEEGITVANRAQVAQYFYFGDKLKKQLEDLLEIIKSNIDAAARRLGEIQTTEQLEKFTQAMPDGVQVNFKCTAENYVSIDGEMRDAAYAFLVANGLGAIIKETVHPATLKAQIDALTAQTFGDDENVPEDAEPMQTLQEVIQDKIMFWQELQDDAANAPKFMGELPECFKVGTVIRSKITYRKVL